jgi:microtubule-associated protein 1
MAANADQASEKTTTPFLLLVIGEPHTPEQRELILPRIIRELSSWDDKESGCDLNSELQLLAAKAPVGEDGQGGEKIIEYQSDLVRIEVLINPTLKMLTGRLRSFLLAPTTYRHLVHAGLLLRETGCWLLQDGVFAAAAFADLLRSTEVSNAAKQGTILGKIFVTAHAEGDWSEAYLARAAPSPLVLHLNREASGSPSSGFVQFGGYISSFVRAAPLGELLPASGVVGNIRFSRPTIYVFPGCQGDSALFGVSGFSLLVNGGYARRSCFWDFTRHLDRIDAMLVSHLGADNVFGLASFAERKARDSVHPEIGHVLMNAPDVQPAPRQAAVDSAAGEPNAQNGHKPAGLVVSIADEANSLADNLRKIGLTVNKCVGGIPTAAGLPSMNLYHKVGHGSLDLYVLNPTHDSRPLKDFLTQWARNGSGFGTRGSGIPLANTASICALLVWRPTSPTDTITRILFPGNTPQSQIFEALDKMKSMSIFQHASCTEKDLSGKVGGGVASTTKKAAAAPAPKSAAQAPQPIQKPANLPVATKSEKLEPSKDASVGMAKKPHSAAVKKETGKVTSPTKHVAKETKKTDAVAGHVVAATAVQVSPTDSQHSQSSKPDETAPAVTEDAAAVVEKVAETAAPIVDVSPLGHTEDLTAAEEVDVKPALDTDATSEVQLHAMDGDVAVGNLLDLQAVPEPLQKDEDSLVDEEHAPVQSVHASENYSQVTADSKMTAAVVDDDKDIDTTELLPSSSEGFMSEVRQGHSVAEAPGFEEDIVSSTPFGGEEPESLPSPAEVLDKVPAVVAGHRDSLDDGTGLTSEKTEDELLKEPTQFSLVDLGVRVEGQSGASLNPFLGISDTDIASLEPTTVEPHFGGSAGMDTQYFTQSGPVMADFSGEQKADENDERDSLEREVVQHPAGGDEFDPQTEWGHPMSLPAPNKPAGGKNDGASSSDKSAEKKTEVKKATSPTKPLASKPAASAGAKYQSKKDDTVASKDEDKAEGGETAAKHPASAASKKGRPGDASARVEPSKAEPPKSARAPPAKKPQAAVGAGAAAKIALKPVVPFYVDLAYIPAHGTAEYVNFEFFRRVRARYYVLSTVTPDPATLGALLDAKATWDDADAEVTIIPTYDADVLRFWMGAHRDQLSQARVDIAPSANRCTIQLQDHDTGCSAYRLEF